MSIARGSFLIAILAGLLISVGVASATELPVCLISSQAINEEEDPFWVPPDLATFTKNRLSGAMGERARAEALIETMLLPIEKGGLGIQYSNDRTRTISEVWYERKANCLSLTMMYVMLAKQLQINAVFAESLAAVNWSRAGDVVLKEKHMVAVLTLYNLVADFLYQSRVRYGNYFLKKVTDARAKSMYYSNCAVEAFIANDIEGAIEKLTIALEVDPTSSQAWNIKGVIEKSKNKTVDAEMSYKVALRNNPGDVSVIGNLAALYREEGYFEEATRLRAVEDRLRKMDPYYHAFLAAEAIENNNFRKAKSSINRAIKIHPKEPDFYIALGHIHQARNKTGDAIKALLKAKEHALSTRVAKIDRLIQEYGTNSITR